MSTTLNLRLTDQTFAAIQRAAVTSGRTASEEAAAMLEQQCDHARSAATLTTPCDDAKAARERFERHFGAIDGGSSVGADNAQIDADLAREYSA